MKQIAVENDTNCTKNRKAWSRRLITQKVESMCAGGERGRLIDNFKVYQDKELLKYSKGKRWKKPPEVIEILALSLGRNIHKSFQTDGCLLAKVFSRKEVIAAFVDRFRDVSPNAILKYYD